MYRTCLTLTAEEKNQIIMFTGVHSRARVPHVCSHYTSQKCHLVPTSLSKKQAEYGLLLFAVLKYKMRPHILTNHIINTVLIMFLLVNALRP